LGVNGPFAVASSGTFTLPLGTWHHVAGVREADQLRIYVDGVLRGSASISSSADFSNPSQTFSIGGGQGGSPITYGANFFGRIDEVRLSDAALAPSLFLNSAVPEPAAALLVLPLVGLGIRCRRDR
jgi:hypothetical protein